MALSSIIRSLHTQRSGVTTNLIPLGTAIAGDPELDPDNIFNASTGLTMSSASTDYAPLIAPFFGFIVQGGAGGQSAVNVAVQYRNGSTFIWNISAVAANEQWIIEGEMTKILKTGTTATLVFPIF